MRPEFERSPEFQPTPETIAEFQGENRYLSNMWELEVPIETEYGPVSTTEHAYQMSKFSDPEAQRLIAAARDGKKAKRVARMLAESGVPINEGWYEDREEIMLELNREKFRNNPELKAKLLETGDARLEEGNNWNDTFWGICPPGSGNGQNKLGIIIEQVRDELK
jgi:ribA/ribD-fused uncharacterized protein